jgi:hypothetical protein
MIVLRRRAEPSAEHVEEHAAEGGEHHG